VKKPRKFVRQLWSAEELERLRTVYPDASADELVRQFKRTLRKIYGAAQRYGIHRSPAFMAALYAEEGRRLAQAGMVLRLWVAVVGTRLLRDLRRDPHRTASGFLVLCTTEALRHGESRQIGSRQSAVGPSGRTW
jgi:hypothetical protein